MPVIYTAEVVSTGDGRRGAVRSSDGLIDTALASPKEVGGSGEGTNPEQLFAAGYSACFHSAMRIAAREAKITLRDDIVTASVDLVRGEDGYHLAAAIVAELPGLDQATADRLVAAAHQRCPYSKATRGNIEVTLLAKI
jgi:Ohr subfamily peroxiredoxin